MPAWKSTRVIAFLSFKKKFQWFADLLFTLHSLIWHIGTKFYILSLRFRPQNLLQILLVLIYTSKEKMHSLWCYFSVHTEQTLPQEVTWMIWPELERIHSLTVIVIICFFYFRLQDLHRTFRYKPSHQQWLFARMI